MADEPLFISAGRLSPPNRHSGDMNTRDNLTITADALDFQAGQLERMAVDMRVNAALLRSIARHPSPLPEHDDG